MKVVESLTDIPPVISPIALTLGVFDGIHLGHRSLIDYLHKLTHKTGTCVLLTFSNHPSHVLRSDLSLPLLISFKHRLHLLENCGVDLTIALPFTREFAEQSYLDFLHFLHRRLPFSHLVLGEDAAFGKNQEGNAEQLKTLQEKMGFKTHYLKKKTYHKTIISSGYIRSLIQKGALKKIKKCLGRPYSIRHCLDSTPWVCKGASYFLSFEKKGLCMLPSGIYNVDLEGGREITSGVASLTHKNSSEKFHLSVTICSKKAPPRDKSLNVSFPNHPFRPWIRERISESFT